MALKSFYTEATEVPEDVKQFYSEDADGRFVLQIADIDTHPKVSGVINANNANKQKLKERQAELEKLRAKVAGLPEDFDPDEYAALKAGGNSDEQIQALKESHTKAVAALRAEHKAALDAIAEQVAERDSYIDGQTRRDALSAALDEAGFDPAHKPMLSKFLADQIQVRREEDGSRVAFADTNLGEVSPVDFVKDFAAKEGKMYLAKPTGPAATGNNAGRTNHTSGDFGGDKAARTKAIAERFPELQ